MVVAVRTMTTMDVPSDDVVDVAGVRDDVMAAADTVYVIGGMAGTGVSERAIIGIALRRGNLMLIDVLAMNMVQMSIVHVVDVIIVPNTKMTTVVAVPVLVLIVNVMLHDIERIPCGARGQLAAALRFAALQAAQMPNSVRSWPVVLKPRGGLASTLAQPSNS